MKYYTIKVIAAVLFCSIIVAQEEAIVTCKSPEELEKAIYEHWNSEFNIARIGTKEKYFTLKGEKANLFYQSLLDFSHKNKINKHITVFKHVTVPGMDEKIRFKVHRGIHGFKPEKGSFYFRTFNNNKHKTTLIENMGEYEKQGVVVYIKSDKRKLITDEEQLNHIIAFVNQ